MYMEISIMRFNNIIGKITLLFTIIFAMIYASVAYAQPQQRRGPPILCGQPVDLMKFKENYKEEEFMILQQKTNSNDPYFILYRNWQTGSWTFLVYNIPSSPPNTICMINGGLSSYIIPDKIEIEKMIDKQNKGLDKAKELNDETPT